MSFTSELQAFQDKTEQKMATISDGVDAETFRSVVEGSEITGSPGQPIDPDPDKNAGELHDSWTIDRVSDTETVISTDVSYALDVEENAHGQHFRNHGPHSVKLTVAGFDRIVELEAGKVA